MYEFLSDHPERSTRFSNMMRGFTSGPAFDLRFVSDFYPWEDYGDSTFVDVSHLPSPTCDIERDHLTCIKVGGSQGFVCEALARKYPSLKFVVQDLEEVVRDARRCVSSDVADRIDFMAHDFFTPQPVVAEIYFLRWIFHNWSDKYCVKILQALIPALRPGAKVIISEAVLPGPDGMPKNMEIMIRGFDLVMSSIQNARERELDDWKDLFKKADARYSFEEVISPAGSNHSLIVAVWKGS